MLTRKSRQEGERCLIWLRRRFFQSNSPTNQFQADSSSSSNLLIELISHHCLCEINSICINNSLLIIGWKKLKTIVLDEIFDEHWLHAFYSSFQRNPFCIQNKPKSESQVHHRKIIWPEINKNCWKLVPFESIFFVGIPSSCN